MKRRIDGVITREVSVTFEESRSVRDLKDFRRDYFPERMEIQALIRKGE
mgnify:CR=1 FL=1